MQAQTSGMSDEDEFGDLYADLAPCSAPAFSGKKLHVISSSSLRFFEEEEDELVSKGFCTLGLDESEEEGKERKQKLLHKVEVFSKDDSEEQRCAQGEAFKVVQAARLQSELKGDKCHLNISHHHPEETGTTKPNDLAHKKDSPAEESVKCLVTMEASAVRSAQLKTMEEGGVIKQNSLLSINDDDLESDSDDDLRIVLNDGLPVYQRSERAGLDRSSVDESEDDGEDFVVLAGDEVMGDKEWGEEPPLLISEGPQASAAEKICVIGGEQQVGAGDEKGQTGKGMGQQHQRKGYTSHVYHHKYRYIRPGAIGVKVASNAGGSCTWVGKCSSLRSDWAGRQGFWSNSALRSHFYGFEYILPSNKTIFDIDIESLEEKPWRQCVDVSDFFNFGFNEHSWKDYCKRLVQLRLEGTKQGKIQVYESGRSEQGIKPNFPPELITPTRVYHQQADTAILSGRVEVDTLSTGQAIRVEGGGLERWPSVDTRKHRTRESDAILLFDATDVCLPNHQENDTTIQAEDKEWNQTLSQLHDRSQNDVQEGIENGKKLEEESLMKPFLVDMRSLSTTRHKIPRSFTSSERISVQEKRRFDRFWSKANKALFMKVDQGIRGPCRAKELQENQSLRNVHWSDDCLHMNGDWAVYAKGHGSESILRVEFNKQIAISKPNKHKADAQNKKSLENGTSRMTCTELDSMDVYGTHEGFGRVEGECEYGQVKLELRDDKPLYEGDEMQTSKITKHQDWKGDKETKPVARKKKKKKKKKRKIDSNSILTEEHNFEMEKAGQLNKIRVWKEKVRVIEQEDSLTQIVFNARNVPDKNDTNGGVPVLKDKDEIDIYPQQQEIDADLKSKCSEKRNRLHRRKAKKDHLQERVRPSTMAELMPLHDNSVLDFSRENAPGNHSMESENSKQEDRHGEFEGLAFERNLDMKEERIHNSDGTSLPIHSHNIHLQIGDPAQPLKGNDWPESGKKGKKRKRRSNGEHDGSYKNNNQPMDDKIVNKRKRHKLKARLMKDADEKKDLLVPIAKRRHHGLDSGINKDDNDHLEKDCHSRKLNTGYSHGCNACSGVQEMVNKWPEKLCEANGHCTSKDGHEVARLLTQEGWKQRHITKFEHWTNQRVMEIDRLFKKGRQFEVVISAGGVEQGPQSDITALEAMDIGIKVMGRQRTKSSRKVNGMFGDEATANNRLDEQQPPLSEHELELAAKMEKRKERFKAPIIEEKALVLKQPLSNCQPLDTVKGERPVRKRRWGC